MLVVDRKKRTKINTSSVAIILILIALLSFSFLESQMDRSETHLRVLNDIRLIRQIDTQLNKDVLSVRSGILSNYDSLVRSNEHIFAILDNAKESILVLESAPYFFPGLLSGRTQQYADIKDHIIQHIAEYKEIDRTKINLLEQFKARNAVLSNSIRSFPVLGGAIIDEFRQDPLKRTLVDNIISLEQSILTYTATNNATLKDPIEQQIAAIREEGEQLSLAEWNKIKNILRHAELIISHQEGVQIIIQRILNVGHLELIDHIYEDYSEHHRIVHEEAEIYRLMLYTTLLLLIIYVVYILFKLHKTTKLLEDTNLNLENRIEERTADLKLSEERYNLAVQGASVGLWDWDILTGDEYWSPRFLQILGIDDPDFVPTYDKFINRLHPEDKDFVSESVDKHLKYKKEYDIDFRLKHENGSYIWVHARGQAVWDGQGKPMRMAGSLIDITDRKKAEDLINIAKEEAENAYSEMQHYAKELERTNTDLEDARHEAERANYLKSEFLANMSHEIRTPMNGVIGTTELLLDTKLSKEQKQLASTIHKSGKSLLEIINDILDLSKIEASELSLEPEDANLPKIIMDIITLLQPQADQKNITLINEYDSTAPHFIVADPVRLRQIIMNLVGNALKFTDKGSVTIKVTNENVAQDIVTLAFEVTDTGMGIPEDKLDYIFNKFSQADESSMRKFGGTGLGLAICKRLTEMMEGEIGVKSTLGKGSTFWFTIPFLIGERKGGGGSLPSTEEGERTFDAAILLVEDNDVNQLVARKMLEKMGCTVDIANNGHEAVEQFDKKDYDLIFMDCQMPEMDGFEATEAIRKKENGEDKITIVALTANALQGDKEKCLAAGMNDYISKPVSKESLHAVLTEHLSPPDLAVNI